MIITACTYGNMVKIFKHCKVFITLNEYELVLEMCN